MSTYEPKHERPTRANARRDEAWQPRIEREAEFNAFVNDATQPEPSEPVIQDAQEDTAPLQGSHDFSDEDSVVNEPDDRSLQQPAPPDPQLSEPAPYASDAAPRRSGQETI